MCLFGFATRGFAQDKIGLILNVNLCEIITNPIPYQNKIVRIKATYRWGFELSELFCSDCWNKDNGSIHVRFDDAAVEKNSRSRFLKVITDGGNDKTLKVAFIGRFYNTNPNRIVFPQFRLEVIEVEKAIVLSKYAPAPSNLEPSIRKQTYCEIK